MHVEEPQEQTVSTFGQWLHRVLWVACLASLLVVGLFSYHHLSYKSRIFASAKADLQQVTVDAARDIDTILQQAIASAEGLADRLTRDRITGEDMLAGLREMLSASPNYYGGTITFAPYGYDPKARLYSAYYSKSGTAGALEYLQLADVYDYTTPEYDWYVEPMAQGNRWGEPYWDEAGKTYMITYSALFYRTAPETGEKIPNGVVTVDISMARIKDIVESLDIGPSGFGALTTRDGNYLYHPNSEYVLTHQNIRDVARQKGDANRLLIASKAAKEEGGILDHTSTTTGEASWLIFEPVPTSGWSLQNTFIRSDLDIDVDALRQQLVWILSAAIVFLSTVAALMQHASLGLPRRIWYLTAVVSLLLVVGISLIWDLALTYHPAVETAGVKVSDKATLHTVMRNYGQSSERKHLDAPVYIPTGLYIDAIEFSNANDLLVSGRLWQQYGEDFPDCPTRGIEIGRSKSVVTKQIGRYPVKGGEVVHWSFQAVLRTEVDSSRYPLEVEHLSIQLLPRCAVENIVLVPDLDAYTLTTATLLPGLDPEVFLPGWTLDESYFVLRASRRNTDFGVKQNFDREATPTLYYEIGIKRMFVDAFISNLTPLIVASIVLFAVVLLSKHVEVGRLMSVCVAVFFVVVFSHLDIRKNISAGEIFYLEYFFFVTYFAIILAPMNAFRLALGRDSRFFEYRDGILAKAVYWPSILMVFFVITVLKFY